MDARIKPGHDEGEMNGKERKKNRKRLLRRGGDQPSHASGGEFDPDQVGTAG
jgi:hypothetical protein